MRVNLPVSQNEMEVPSGQHLVSRTDLKGNITYVNRAFVDVSGFPHEELLGEPHNVVRHPDMPAAVFEDLWNTIIAGRPWTGVVKNRRKNGDFYWVYAMVSQVIENGAVVGYQSVRRKASREQIAEAERRYARLNGGDGGATLTMRWRRIARGVTLKMRLIALITLLSLLLAGVGFKSLSDSGTSGEEIDSLVAQRLLPLSQLQTVSVFYEGKIAEVILKTRGPDVNWTQRLSALQEAQRARDEAWSRFRSEARSGSEAGLVEEVQPLMDAAGRSLRNLEELLRARDAAAIAQYAERQLYPAIEPVSERLERLMALLVEAARSEYGAGKARHESSRTLVLTLVPGGILASMLAGFLLYRALMQGVNRTRDYFERMAKGEFDVEIEIGQQDESARILEAARNVQVRLVSDINAVLQREIESDRLRAALDSGSSLLMIADAERRICYINESFKTTFRRIAPEVRKTFPRFDVDRLLGQSIDQFHKNPAHQRQILADLRGTVATVAKLGESTFRITVNPVINSKGERLGSVAEWYDLTEELKATERDRRLLEENTRIRVALDNVSTAVMIADTENDIVYVNRALVGELGQAQADIRRDVPQFDAQRLVGTRTDQFLPGGGKQAPQESKVLDNLAQTIRTQMKLGGHTFALSVNPVLTVAGERLGSVMEWRDRTAELAAEKEVVRLVREAGVGNLAERASLDILPRGFLRDTGEGINKILDAMAGPMNDIVRILEALARGDLTQQITADYQGTFGKLRDDANASVANLARSVMTIKYAAEAINTASREIAMGNADLSQRTEEQASSLEETASSMEQLASTVRQNADNARQANQMAVAASGVAMRGGEVVQRVVGTMQDINESSRKIVDIISVIDGIAFQTNILALNAAVEAARAGEQGRGFAVVAGEVRNLAQRSAGAAKEIKGLIGDSVEKVEDGAKLVSEAGRTMEEIVASVRRVTDIMSEIAVASAQQSSGIEQVNQAITHMDEATQQNAALVEQAAAAAESLDEQASNLASAMARFRVTGDSARLPA